MHNQSVALVTGANKGIGLAIATQLAAHGLAVLLGARSLARIEPDPVTSRQARCPPHQTS